MVENNLRDWFTTGIIAIYVRVIYESRPEANEQRAVSLDFQKIDEFLTRRAATYTETQWHVRYTERRGWIDKVAPDDLRGPTQLTGCITPEIQPW